MENPSAPCPPPDLGERIEVPKAESNPSTGSSVIDGDFQLLLGAGISSDKDRIAPSVRYFAQVVSKVILKVMVWLRPPLPLDLERWSRFFWGRRVEIG